jgi:hypothetical protein
MGMRIRPIAWVGMLALAVVSSACGESDVTVAGGGGGSKARGPERPVGGEVVVQILHSGGFVPVEAALTTVPTTTVLGDGTVITSAPVPAIYPGPAITPLQSRTISASEVDGLVEKARSLGLLAGPLEFGRPLVADAADTTVTIVAGGTTHRHTAYALDIGEVRGSTRGQAGQAGRSSGVSEAEAKNREALSAFIGELMAASGAGERPWSPPAVAVYVLGSYLAPDPTLTQPPQPWPLAQAPETQGDRPCTLVEGNDVPTLLQALAKANALTPWVIGGTQRSVAFRPLVPGQPGCNR